MTEQHGDQRQHLRELLRASQRRLQVLELQKGQQGGQTPPHIVTEIEDLQGEVAKLAAQLDAATPTLTRTQQRQIRADAFKAFLLKDWQQTEDLAAQVVEVNPGDQETRQWLDAARRALGAAALYGALQELKGEGNWQAVLEGMEAYEREYSSTKDEDSLKHWAEQRKSLEELCRNVQTNRALGEWQRVLIVLIPANSKGRTTHIPELQDARVWAVEQAKQYVMYMTAYVCATQGDVYMAGDALSFVNKDWPDTQHIRRWIYKWYSRNKYFVSIYSSFAALKVAHPEEEWLETIQEEVKLHQEQHPYHKLGTKPPVKDVLTESVLLDFHAELQLSKKSISTLLEQLKNLRVAHGIHEF